MKNTFFLISWLLFSLGITTHCYGVQELTANFTAEPPTIDGLADDTAWNLAQEITTLDKVSGLQIRIRAVYSEKYLYLLVRFPDPDESRSHKSWTWDKAREIYKVGYDREDIFIIKWNMLPNPVDLSIYADNPYQADIWFWKACRTDGTGYADDKTHILSLNKDRNATEVISASGKKMYLLRKGDTGTSAYSIVLKPEFEGEILPRYSLRPPTGSRGDVHAKGLWVDKEWTIEFQRKLETDNPDDLQFTTVKNYLFGVSRYEIAGREANSKLSAPLYGTGDVSEPLWLKFIK